MVMRMIIKITVPSMSALESRIKMAMGIVSVLNAIEPPIVIVAPNSPNALAQVRIAAARIPRLLSGRVVERNA